MPAATGLCIRKMSPFPGSREPLIDESMALRGIFLIDRDGIVRHQVVNDLPLGRNVDEAVRMVDALRFHEENGEVCPAGWRNGLPGIVPSPAGVAKYLAAHAESL